MSEEIAASPNHEALSNLIQEKGGNDPQQSCFSSLNSILCFWLGPDGTDGEDDNAPSDLVSLMDWKEELSFFGKAQKRRFLEYFVQILHLGIKVHKILPPRQSLHSPERILMMDCDGNVLKLLTPESRDEFRSWKEGIDIGFLRIKENLKPSGEVYSSTFMDVSCAYSFEILALSSVEQEALIWGFTQLIEDRRQNFMHGQASLSYNDRRSAI
mmetsp:Transcript_68/g.73  ORF Transcript_68/g.73 Transcript_68/m.73 type:complete len:213 (-) Transcript_68:56-694(-)